MIFFLIFIFWSSSEAHLSYNFTHQNSVVIDARIDQGTDILESYQMLISDMPDYLDWIIAHRKPFCIIIPDSIEGVGPLELTAPFIEGARTALAWIQSYKRLFSNALIEYKIVPESQYNPKKDVCPVVLGTKKQALIIFKLPWLENITKKTVLITGGAGFIGSHLVQHLLSHGHRVVVVDNLVCSTGKNISKHFTNPDFCFIEHDVSVPFDCEGGIEYVIHAASIPSPADYYQLPIQTMNAGILGTRNTLQIARNHHARYLFLSTSEVYGDPEVHPQVESYAGKVDCLCSRSPYDQSKRGAETLIKLYYEKYALDVRIARIFNTYGPGMRLHDGRVITNFIAALIENTPITIYGDGSQTRSLCYIDDIVAGLSLLLFSNRISSDISITERVFNLGNPEEYSINEIAQEMVLLGDQYQLIPLKYKKIENFDKADPRKRKPEITRANRVLGFMPHVPFKQGIQNTLAWFLNPGREKNQSSG